jgi:hypothetical protein
MVESGSTPVSPISGGNPAKSPRQAVEGFLKYTVDTPDLEKAKLHLTRRSVASGSFDAAAVPPGSTYTLGAEEADELGKRIPVNVRSPGEGGIPQEMTVQVVVMEEEGAWKIDLPATLERMMGGAMSAVGEMMGQAFDSMSQAMSTAMTGVTQALTAGVSGKPAAQTSAPKAQRPVKKPQPAAPKPKKRAKNAARAATRSAKPAPVRKKSAKKPARKPKPAKKKTAAKKKRR